MLNRWLVVVALLTLALAASPSRAQGPLPAPGEPARVANYNLMGERIGLVGYDPVSYFPEGGSHPRKGLIRFTQEHDGVTYRFSTQEHLELFRKNPGRYVPVFGGWCAWAVGALGKRVDVDPESYLIRDGRLFLFYRDSELDTRALWLKDEANLRQKAQANWAGLNQ